MSKRDYRPALIVAALCLLSVSVPGAQVPAPQGPQMPYEDVGACPFECCTYREWTATARVTAWRDRRAGSGVAFVAEKGERIRAPTDGIEAAAFGALAEALRR